MKFKETNNTSFKRLKEGFKECDDYLFYMFKMYVSWFISLLLIIILIIFYTLYRIFNGIIEIIKDVFSEFLLCIKFLFSDDFWSYLLAWLQDDDYIKVLENTEDEHEDEQESE